MTFDPASVCVQWEYREWKYQKMSEVGGLAYRFSGVHFSQVVRSSQLEDVEKLSQAHALDLESLLDLFLRVESADKVHVSRP